MITECWAIVVVIVLLSLLLLRQEKRQVGLSLLPLMIVPLAHLMAGPAVQLFISKIQFPFHFLVIAVDVLGLVAACIAIGAVGAFIRNRKIRWLYFFSCGGFSLILSWVLLYNTIGRFL